MKKKGGVQEQVVKNPVSKLGVEHVHELQEIQKDEPETPLKFNNP